MYEQINLRKVGTLIKKFAIAKSQKISDENEICLIRCEVNPSMTSKIESNRSHTANAYFVKLCFSTEKLINFPYTCCECPDGCGYCSHLIAVLGVLHMV